MDNSQYQGWANFATYNMAQRLDTLDYRAYVIWAWANRNPGGTIKEYCATLGIIDADVNWDEIEEIYSLFNS
jgi:hypothetical protein